MALLYMVFDNLADAQHAADGITAGLGLPTAPENVTVRWNHVRQRNDGKFIVMWPGRNDLIPPDAAPFAIEEYDKSWRPAEPGPP